MTSTDGRCVAMMRWIPTARASAQMPYGIFDVLRRHHHQVREIVDVMTMYCIGSSDGVGASGATF
jgi:hypothetical protein